MTTTTTQVDEENISLPKPADEQQQQKMNQRPSNEYVLNVAFVSFLAFTTLQFFFAVIAKSQAMMADCAAMYVDVITYLFNFLAERLKQGHSGMSSRQLRLHRLYLELIPPLISVTTLFVVTVMSLDEAIRTLWPVNDGDGTAGSADGDDDDGDGEPDLFIMITFSSLNLLLDVMNVGCFASVNQAVGIVPGNDGIHKHSDDHVCLHDSHHHHQHPIEPEHDHGHNHGHGHNHDKNAVVTEASPLVTKTNTTTLLKKQASTASLSTCSSNDTITRGGMNLNMCSAWTHIFADTMRSIAVLLAVALAYIFPDALSPTVADAGAAIVVSVIIFLSLLPLLQGLWQTLMKIRAVWQDDQQQLLLEQQQQQQTKVIATYQKNANDDVVINV